MTDENTTSTNGWRPGTGVSSAVSAAPPSGHGLRRAMTVSVAEDAAAARRASASSFPAMDTMPPRRSSNFSEYSLSEARDILNPQPRGPGSADTFSSPGDSSSLASLSLAFALLPALAGVLFKNGSAVVTDVMLLGLAGVFLHWSVTQPWAWYHSAQEVRIQHEATAESVIEDDSDLDSSSNMPAHSPPLDHVPEDEETQPESHEDLRERHPTTQQQSALAELYVYEIIALASCFALPLIGAYLLHAIRSQLSRPSEGLVSNYNLTIFLLVSELRVLSHMIKLLQSRTLHLQRVVQGSPSSIQSTRNAEQLEAVLARLDRLECRITAEDIISAEGSKQESSRSKQQDNAVARDVRNAIQPELDALNRAVRRYEKKATLLQFQTESRFAGVESKLDDAIALAASAAKNSASHKNIFLWAIESLTALVLLPFKALLRILLLPLSTLLALTSKSKRKAPTSKSSRGRNGKAAMQPRYNGDRVPTRVSKR
ncbi:hypothetical protein Neosp_000430 [[Neocosmospora] mangrovei]